MTDRHLPPKTERRGRKRNSVGRCLLCVQHVNNLTREHLFPKAWYIPELTTETTTRQTFPSCDNCNGSHGRSEQRIWRILGLSLNPEVGPAASIAKKVIHSLSMSEAPNAKEAQIRGKDKLNILRNSSPVQQSDRVENLNFLPGLNVSQSELENGGRLTQINGEDIRKLIHKIVRGATYLEYQLYIEEDQEILWQKCRLPEFECAENGKRVTMPGMQIDFGWQPSKDGAVLLLIITIWERLQFYAAVTPGQVPIWSDTISGVRTVNPLWRP